MAILVTGGAGYIGSVTVENLLSRGENVVVLDNLSRGHREALGANVIFYQGNVGDRELLERITTENEIESCVHFAALAYVGESIEKPREYFEANLKQGIALLGSLLKAGVRRVVFSSSCATYGDPEHLPIIETARQFPINPYGWTKLLFELHRGKPLNSRCSEAHTLRQTALLSAITSTLATLLMRTYAR